MRFPADATHLRLARGGLDKQAAILPLIGRLRMTILDMKLAENTTPILVGAQSDVSPVQPAISQQPSPAGVPLAKPPPHVRGNTR